MKIKYRSPLQEIWLNFKEAITNQDLHKPSSLRFSSIPFFGLKQTNILKVGDKGDELNFDSNDDYQRFKF